MRSVPMTGRKGEPLLPAEEMEQPVRGSVVLVGGLTGTAWQRHHADGLWHSTLSRMKAATWDEMVRRRNVVLIYDAEHREGQGR